MIQQDLPKMIRQNLPKMNPGPRLKQVSSGKT